MNSSGEPDASQGTGITIPEIKGTLPRERQPLEDRSTHGCPPQERCCRTPSIRTRRRRKSYSEQMKQMSKYQQRQQTIRSQEDVNVISEVEPLQQVPALFALLVPILVTWADQVEALLAAASRSRICCQDTASARQSPSRERGKGEPHLQLVSSSSASWLHFVSSVSEHSSRTSPFSQSLKSQ